MLFKKIVPVNFITFSKPRAEEGGHSHFYYLVISIYIIIMLYINNRSGQIYIFKLLNKDCPTKIGHRSRGPFPVIRNTIRTVREAIKAIVVCGVYCMAHPTPPHRALANGFPLPLTPCLFNGGVEVFTATYCSSLLLTVPFPLRLIKTRRLLCSQRFRENDLRLSCNFPFKERTMMP